MEFILGCILYLLVGIGLFGAYTHCGTFGRTLYFAAFPFHWLVLQALQLLGRQLHQHGRLIAVALLFLVLWAAAGWSGDVFGALLILFVPVLLITSGSSKGND